MNLLEAKKATLGHYPKDEYKNVFVTYPGGAVWFNNDLDRMQEYADSKKLTLVVVKLNGKIVGDSIEEIVIDETADTSVQGKSKKGKNK